MLAYLFWDPPREMFPVDLPLIGRPILWYGFFFALGFFLAYQVLRQLLKAFFHQKNKIVAISEKISLYAIIGGIVGARLGDLLFYQKWQDIIEDPMVIIRVWQGGLASHGGAVGILIALAILARRLKKELNYRQLLDLTAIPTALAAGCIRIGNFFNQEILGTETTLPWGVIFGHPIDGSTAVPRHPVQLYESLFYFFLFALLALLWKKLYAKPGKTMGLFLIFLFTFRFCVEFLKLEQSVYLGGDSLFTMGQYLSVPFIVLGAILLFRKGSSE